MWAGMDMDVKVEEGGTRQESRRKSGEDKDYNLDDEKELKTETSDRVSALIIANLFKDLTPSPAGNKKRTKRTYISLV